MDGLAIDEFQRLATVGLVIINKRTNVNPKLPPFMYANSLLTQISITHINALIGIPYFLVLVSAFTRGGLSRYHQMS